ncbi:MAG: glutathione S-transferase N-terminal domain-containing protein [Candidatus Pacebacteria bacterium]|jgi:glutathione S-transferase|nr:glutathione S-transferase N-terminal domain-containing protein [Candidatus Paceibacterota bacterium]
MLNLYYKPTCPYCQRVLAANETMKAPLVLKDVRSNPAIMAELLEKGGKSQVPYLDDTDTGVQMYESIDIIEYLRKNYGNGVSVTVAEVGNVCPID